MATRLERSIDWGTKLKGLEVTYRFVDKGEKSPSPFGKVVSAGFGAYEKAQFKEAFKLFASFTDLRFRQVGDASVADLSLTSFKDDQNSLGAMGPPGYGLSAGYGAFNYRGIGWDYQEPGSGGLEQGGFGFITIIHELGHGLGLAHPHDSGGGSSVFPGVSGSERSRPLRPEPGRLHHDVVQRRVGDQSGRGAARLRLRIRGDADGDRYRRPPGQVRRQRDLPQGREHLPPPGRQPVRDLLRLHLGRGRPRCDRLRQRCSGDHRPQGGHAQAEAGRRRLHLSCGRDLRRLHHRQPGDDRERPGRRRRRCHRRQCRSQPPRRRRR